MINDNRGFTLIEIMIAISLSVILLASVFMIIQHTAVISTSVVDEGNLNIGCNTILETVRNATANAVSMEVKNISSVDDVTLVGNDGYIACIDNTVYFNGTAVESADTLNVDSLQLVFSVDGLETLLAHLYVDGNIYPETLNDGEPTERYYIPSIFGSGDDCVGIQCSDALDLMDCNCIYFTNSFD